MLLDNTKIYKAAESIAHWVFCDVGAMLDVMEVHRVLERDIAAGAPVPSEGEIETLVCGEVESVESLRLAKRYPALDAWLGERLT